MTCRSSPSSSSATAATTRPGSRRLRARRGAGRAERLEPARGPLRQGRSSTSTWRGSRDPDHLNLPRSFYTGNASLRDRADARGGRLRRVVRRLRQRGRRAGPAPARRRGRRSTTTRRRSPTRSTGRTCAASQRDTLAKGPHHRAARPRPPGGLRRAAAGRPRTTARGPGSRPGRCCSGAPGGFRRRRRRVFALAALLERLGLWRQPLFYRAVLDYAFWAGVGRRSARIKRRGRAARARQRAAPWPDRSSSTRIAAFSAAPRTRCSCCSSRSIGPSGSRPCCSRTLPASRRWRERGAGLEVPVLGVSARCRSAWPGARRVPALARMLRARAARRSSTPT